MMYGDDDATNQRRHDGAYRQGFLAGLREAERQRTDLLQRMTHDAMLMAEDAFRQGLMLTIESNN